MSTSTTRVAPVNDEVLMREVSPAWSSAPVAPQVTFSTPCMIVRWGSQTKWYVPFFSFTVQFVV